MRLVPSVLSAAVLSACALSVQFALPGVAHAELPLDTVGTMPVPPARNRVYVSDFSIMHVPDSRVTVYDADKGRFLGLLGTGFAGQFTLSPDGKDIYVTATYLSRLQRGERTDVVEIYDAQALAFRREIVIESKRAQALNYRGYLRTSSDGRLLYVQNATPATSVAVIDLQAGKPVAEVDTPGCWGIFPSATQARRFSALCGDGTVATVTLNDDGTVKAEGGRTNSPPLFDPKDDALFIHAEQEGDVYRFVSFNGTLLGLNLGGDTAREVERWGLVDAASARQGWRPGGYQPFAFARKRGRLYVAMHAKGHEGSHKQPADEIWVFDAGAHRRIARLPGTHAVALTVPVSGDDALYVVDGVKSALVVRGGAAMKVQRVISPVGEAPTELETSQGATP